MRLTKAIIAVFLVLSLFVPMAMADGVSNNGPVRVINVVYDDSGSMINTGGKNVDTWGQAKYSMEVFAAMLGSNDTMNIYVMSDFDGGSANAGPRVVLNGKNGTGENVSKVHEMVTTAKNTPFDSVRKAYSDLTSAKADEKWLVVLTDGEFQGVSDVDAFFDQKDKTVKVMFLAMGDSAESIKENANENIFFEHAKSNDQILNKITDICTRVFNSHRLTVDSSNKFSFDIPMSELVVFAQGKDVKIKGIENSSGKTINGGSNVVGVKYSEVAATNYSDVIVSKDLVGSLITYTGDYSEGDYKVDVSNAETVEIFYKPKVSIAAYLTNADGDEVTDLDKLRAGDYTIDFGFVRSGSNEKLAESKLLGHVDYEATIENNGTVLDGTYKNGSKLSLTEGDIKIDAIARFLDYNSVSTELSYVVFKDKTVKFEAEKKSYALDKTGISPAESFEIKVTLDDKEPTEEQWAKFPTPSIKTSSKERGKIDVNIEKSTEPGILLLTPEIKGGTPKGVSYGNVKCVIKYSEKVGDEVWAGNYDGTVKVKDTRSFFSSHIVLIISLAAIAMVIGLLLLHVFRVKFPKAMQRKPLIVMTFTKKHGMKPTEMNGSFKIKDGSRVFGPEKAKLKFTNDTSVPRLELKACRHGKMIIENAASYAGKEEILFGGKPIPANTKKHTIPCGITITHNDLANSIMYVCKPMASKHGNKRKNKKQNKR